MVYRCVPTEAFFLKCVTYFILFYKIQMVQVNLPNFLRYYSGSESSDSIRSLNLKGVEILSKETMAQNASHIVTDRFTSLTAEKLNKKVPPPLLITPTSSSSTSSNKKRHVVDYATDHLFRPIKPKPT